jgi:glutamine synthetase adenylyltransferase
MVATIFQNRHKAYRHQERQPRPHQQQVQNQRQKVRDMLPIRKVGYSPDLGRAVGGVTSGLFLSQLLFLSDKGDDPEGWIYKSEAEMGRETGLTKQEQQTARRKLLALGVIQIERRGWRNTYHFRIVWERLEEVIEQYLREQNDTTQPPQNVATTPGNQEQNVPTEPIQKGVFRRFGERD